MVDSTFSHVARYLDSGGALTALRRISLPAADLVPDKTYCHIVPVQPPLRKKSSAHRGFSSTSTQPVPPTACLVVTPLTGKPRTGVSMIRKDGTWSFRPGIIGDLNPKGFFVPFDLSWAEVLCRLSSKTLLPLQLFQSANPFISCGIRDEIDARHATFDYCGPFKFFSQQCDGLAWLVSSLWHSWEQTLLPQQERLAQLNSFICHNLTSAQYHELRPEAVSKKISNGKPILSDFVGTPRPVFSFPQSSSSAINKVNQLAIEAETTSIGAGSIFKRPKASSAKNSSFGAGKEFESKGWWWWRDLASQPDFFREFATKWETSAFFYEFRARRDKNRGREPRWDWVRSTWAELDHTQRGILYCLCPPSDILRRQKALLKVAAKMKNIYTYEISLARPFDEVLAEVRLLWERADAFFHFGESADQDEPKLAAESPRKSPEPKLSSKWNLLEDLDVLQFQGSSAPLLSKKQHVTLKREEAKYRSICEHAGLAP